MLEDKSATNPVPVRAVIHTAVVFAIVCSAVGISLAQPKSLPQAIVDGDEILVKSLLKQGADPNVETRGRSALMYSVEEGKPGLASILVRWGATVNVKNQKGMTPLMLAVHFGYMELCKLLLDNGADPDAQDDERERTPLLMAVARVDTALVQLLLQYRPDLERGEKIYKTTPLAKATLLGQASLMEMLLAGGADKNCLTLSGLTPVMIAAALGNQATLRVLLHAGVDPDIQTRDFAFRRHRVGPRMASFGPVVHGYTALMFAARAGHVSIVDALLRYHADPSPENSRGEKARDLARTSGYGSIVSLLEAAEGGRELPTPPAVCSPRQPDGETDLTTETLHYSYLVAGEPLVEEGLAVVRACADSTGVLHDPYIFGVNSDVLQLFFVDEILTLASSRSVNIPGRTGTTWVSIPVEVSGKQYPDQVREEPSPRSPSRKPESTREATPPEALVRVTTDPAVVKRKEPFLPKEAVLSGIEGRVWVKIWVGEDGIPKQAAIIKSDAEILNDACIEAAMSFEFTPATIDSVPVAVWVSLPFTFHLPKHLLRLRTEEAPWR